MYGVFQKSLAAIGIVIPPYPFPDPDQMANEPVITHKCGPTYSFGPSIRTVLPDLCLDSSMAISGWCDHS